MTTTNEILDGATAPQTSGFVAPAWGLRDVIPAGTILAWGARAIYSARYTTVPLAGKLPRVRRGRPTKLSSTAFEVSIDIVHDRQGWSSHPSVLHPSDDGRAMAAWIDEKAMPALRRMCRGQTVMPADAIVLAYASDGYELRASPRSSYGYLYITCWQVVA